MIPQVAFGLAGAFMMLAGFCFFKGRWLEKNTHETVGAVAVIGAAAITLVWGKPFEFTMMQWLSFPIALMCGGFIGHITGATRPNRRIKPRRPRKNKR